MLTSLTLLVWADLATLQESRRILVDRNKVCADALSNAVRPE